MQDALNKVIILTPSCAGWEANRETRGADAEGSSEQGQNAESANCQSHRLFKQPSGMEPGLPEGGLQSTGLIKWNRDGQRGARKQVFPDFPRSIQLDSCSDTQAGLCDLKRKWGERTPSVAKKTSLERPLSVFPLAPS